MSSSLFATDDGDVILRTGPEPDSKNAFRVHKFILSLASTVFNDMILRFIYPGVETQKIIKLPTLAALLPSADKYNITSIYPALKEALKMFIPTHPVEVYIVAHQFGFLEETIKAFQAMSTGNVTHSKPREYFHLISSADLFRLVHFVR